MIEPPLDGCGTLLVVKRIIYKSGTPHMNKMLPRIRMRLSYGDLTFESSQHIPSRSILSVSVILV